MMAHIAESFADRVVLTSDNPRGEEPGAIIDEMMAGLDRPDDVLVIEDRASAIRQAVLASSPGDIVLIAGKGHEDWQELNGRKIPFSDEATVNAALEEAA